MTLALNDVQFSTLIQHLKDERKSLPIKKAACTIGLQPCGNIWVFTGDIQVRSEILGSTDSPYILGKSLIGQMCNVPSEDIRPKIELPLTTSSYATTILYKWKNLFFKMKGDVGMA